MKPTKKIAKIAKKKITKPAPIAVKRVLSKQPGIKRDTPPRLSINALIASTPRPIPAASIPSTPAADKPTASELPLSLVSAPLSAEELAAARREWYRSKLPGEKLIKVNRKTGERVFIERDEWNRLY